MGIFVGLELGDTWIGHPFCNDADYSPNFVMCRGLDIYGDRRFLVDDDSSLIMATTCCRRGVGP